MLDKRIAHLPPIDFRYGWNLSSVSDQLKLFHLLCELNVTTLFASPTCAPWGSNSRNLQTPEYREVRRLEEEPALEFLAAACFVQILKGGKYIVENPAFSDIFYAESSEETATL